MIRPVPQLAHDSGAEAQVAAPAAAPAVVVDCDGCTARPAACGGCVVTFLLGTPPEGVELDDQEQQALAVLAESGLVPALQYDPAPGPDGGGATAGRRAEGRVAGRPGRLLV
jgi:hypothetical protein